MPLEPHKKPLCKIINFIIKYHDFFISHKKCKKYVSTWGGSDHRPPYRSQWNLVKNLTMVLPISIYRYIFNIVSNIMKFVGQYKVRKLPRSSDQEGTSNCSKSDRLIKEIYEKFIILIQILSKSTKWHTSIMFDFGLKFRKTSRQN